MRGLAQGEASSSSNPVLQLFARSGELLADIYSGSYLIHDISDPTVAPVSKVVSTAIDTTADKLGTGRYLLATGDTTAWVPGTHRAVVTYQMTNGGRTYVQVIEFEILYATDWAIGSLYIGYASTNRLLRDQIADIGSLPQDLHRHIDRISRQIERWTKRSFEPQYRAVRHDGASSPILHLNNALIDLDKVQAIWKASDDGTEETYDYEGYMFQVYNRHLDGVVSPDDRNNPKIVRKDSWTWPLG